MCKRLLSEDYVSVESSKECSRPSRSVRINEVMIMCCAVAQYHETINVHLK